MTVGLEKLTLMNASRELGSTVLFLARGQSYSVDDAIAAAIFRGDLDPMVAETLALANAEARADAEGLEPDPVALQAASEKFRYERDLISAGETEDWLEAHGMTAEDFSGWLYQKLCLSSILRTLSAAERTKDLQCTEENDATKKTPVGAPEILRSAQDEKIDDLSDLLRVHLWMSGEMEKLSLQLSRRVAADLEISQRGEQTPMDLARMEAAFDRLSAAAITDETRKRKLVSMQLSLARIEIESLELNTEAAAREAFLCVRDDGLSLADVAAETGYRSERATFSAGALDEKVGQRLLNAREGEVVGPIMIAGRFKVYQVLQKLEPSVEDPDVAARLDEVILDEFFDDLCARHIQAGDVSPTGK